MTRPPAATKRSAATPRVGLAVRPEYASLPPHCSPRVSSATGMGSRRRAMMSEAMMASDIMALRREPIPVAELTLGLQCGGSDAYSGLTANPTLGVAADLLVAAGGRVILGETPEIYGAEHLLRDRAATPAIAG